MAYTTINKSTDYFNTKLYTGNGSTNAITGVGFQPDWTWIKSRDYSDSHSVYDAVRGVTKRIRPNHTNAEQTLANSLTAFGSDGFTVGSDGQDNSNSQTYASWNWLANGTGSANTDGDINSTVSVNQTAGFSIVKFTGNLSNSTVGHGLGATPSMIIFKSLAGTTDWRTYNKSVGNGSYLKLNTTSASTSSSNTFNNTSPTSTVFSIGSSDSTNPSSDMIAYCFAEKQGFSKFGSYTGNGNANGPFIYTGFKPSFVMIKNASISTNWVMIDNKRPGFNSNNYFLYPNLSDAETTNYGLEILSNGFKPLTNLSWINESGSNIIYMAFGQTLVGTNNIPNNAR